MDFNLEDILKKLNEAASGATNKVAETIFGPSTVSGVGVNYRTKQSPNVAQEALETIRTKPSPKKLTKEELSKQIKEGLTRWGGGTPPPVANYSDQLAELGIGLKDPYFPAVLSLKETGGGKETDINNPFGIMSYDGKKRKLAPYADMAIATLGGGSLNQQGLKGTLQNHYQDFLNTGDLAPFFSKYTPPSSDGNPSLADQLETYRKLRAVFGE